MVPISVLGASGVTVSVTTRTGVTRLFRLRGSYSPETYTVQGRVAVMFSLLRAGVVRPSTYR